MSKSADETLHSVFASATNKRQASKLLDVRTNNVLVCRRDGDIEVTIAKCDRGIHAIWRRLGTYFDDRHVELHTLIGVIDAADSIEIDQNPSKQTKRITCCEEDDGD